MVRTIARIHWLVAPLAGIASLALLVGCSSKGEHAAGTLTPADFRAADADRAPEPAAMSERRAPAYTPHRAGDDEELDLTVLKGAPKLTQAPPTPTRTSGGQAAPPVMMDALIGDINGSPVYATSFFTEAIAARLTGLASDPRKTKAAWIEETRGIIKTRLIDLLRDQLLLAEARASLTPEQKQGLLAVIQHVRRDLVSRGGGGEAAVDESLRQQGEDGLEARLKETIDEQLILANYREKIQPRTAVSWHEVEVEYERRAEKFNPDPIAFFSMIWAPTKKPDVVEQFRADVVAGVPFDELVKRPENEAPNKGAHQQGFKGEYAKAPLFGPSEQNTAAQKLTPGQVAGPIVLGDYTRWIRLDRIETPHAVSIYEAQLAIYKELRRKKEDAEIRKYITNLMGTQSEARLAEMADKLLKIATDRYYTKSR